MRILALFAECVSLLDAETMLLVGYDEREGLELDIRLDYCVSADEKVDFARFEGFFFSPFLRGGVRAGEQLDFYPAALKQL